jgi:hypothetical protein
MADTTSTGPLSLPLTNMRTLLANCSAWQTWTGAASAAEALEHIHLLAVDQPREDDEDRPWSSIRPFAVIGLDLPEFWAAEKHSGGAAGGFVRSGNLLVSFEDNVDDQIKDNYREALVRFLNNVGDVIIDLIGSPGVSAGLSGTGTYLHLTGLTVKEGPHRADRDELANTDLGDYQAITLGVSWGI